MHTATSRDGTPIAYGQRGAGPPLLLVHGTTADHTTTWRFVGPLFARRFTVYAMDRRGRGGSGDGPAYALRREAEDVAAVVDAIAGAAGAPVRVLGHSYGALCALEAALLTEHLHRLVLYEGVPLRGADAMPPGLVRRFEAMRAAGDLEGVLMTLYRELAGITPEELTLLRAQEDAWASRLANAPTVPREMGVEEGYTFTPERFSGVRAPNLLLVGGDSPAREHENARAVAAALPGARVAVLPGQRHAAMYTAPEAFVREVVRFLKGG